MRFLCRVSLDETEHYLGAYCGGYRVWVPLGDGSRHARHERDVIRWRRLRYMLKKCW